MTPPFSTAPGFPSTWLAIAGFALAIGFAGIGCSGSGTKSADDSGTHTGTETGSTSAGQSTPETGSESLDVLPEDDAIIAQAAEGVHTTVVAKNENGAIDLDAGATLSIGLVGARDDDSWSDTNYASYLAERIVESLTQYADAPYVIVAVPADKDDLVDQRLSNMTDEFDSTQLSHLFGELVPANLGMFVEVVAKSDTTEELSVKVYEIGRGVLVCAHRYEFDSKYLDYLQKGEQAEAAGDLETAADYYDMAAQSHRGTDSKAATKARSVEARLPADVRERRAKMRAVIADAAKLLIAARDLMHKRGRTEADRTRAENLVRDAHDKLEAAQRHAPNSLVIKKMLADIERIVRRYRATHNGPTPGPRRGGNNR